MTSPFCPIDTNLVSNQPPLQTSSVKLKPRYTTIAKSVALVGLCGVSQMAFSALSYSDSSERSGNAINVNAPTYPYPSVNSSSPTAVQTSESRTVRIRNSSAGGRVNSSSSSYPSTSYPSTSYPATTVYPTPTSYPNPSYPTTYPNSYSGGGGVELFEQARSAGDRGDTGALFNYEQQMQGGNFAMYPTYWRLNNNLSTLNPAIVSQFAQQHRGSAMAEKLTADYAEAKAQSGDYNAVRQVAGYVTNADDSEACAVALGYNQTDPMRAISLKDEVWLTTKKQPALCDQLAGEMSSNRMITQTDKQERLYRMLREGRTGDIMSLGDQLGTRIAYSNLSEIQLNPNGFLTRFAREPASQKNQYLYLYALGRIADKSYREAHTQLEYDIRQDNARSRPLLDQTTRRHAYRILGVKRMNMNTDDGFNDEAVTWFRNSLGETFNFEEAEDYAQAGIRFSRWQDVINAVDAMSTAKQQEPIWQYWRARAYEQVGNASQKSQARRIYSQLAQSDDYYGLLAKDKVGQRFSAGRERSMPNVSASDMARVMQNPHFARAFALHEADVNRTYVNREWNWAVKQARDNGDNGLILAAAKRANDIGWLDRSIYAMENSTAKNYALSHPMPYQSQVVQYSRQAGIDPAWAYGIMRQESRFQSNARSGVGASGLMQIMPGTAKYIARNLGESYSESRANSGDTNIRYGTWYMSDVMGKLYNQPVLATAGYNAGPNKAKRWQPVYGSLAADQYVDTIAYPETRNYVKHVMENATIYSDLLGNPMPISQRMGTVPAGY